MAKVYATCLMQSQERMMWPVSTKQSPVTAFRREPGILRVIRGLNLSLRIYLLVEYTILQMTWKGCRELACCLSLGSLGEPFFWFHVLWTSLCLEGAAFLHKSLKSEFKRRTHTGDGGRIVHLHFFEWPRSHWETMFFCVSTWGSCFRLIPGLLSIIPGPQEYPLFSMAMMINLSAGKNTSQTFSKGRGF